MTTEGASNGTDRIAEENCECTHTDADAGHGTELDTRGSATATSEGAGTGLMAKGVVVHPVFSDGIARTDRHKVPVTPYCPPPIYARLTPAQTLGPQHITIHPFGSSIFFPGIEDHHSDPLPESSQETAIRAWKRVSIRNISEWGLDGGQLPVVLSRHSKQPEKPMVKARCLHFANVYSTLHPTTASTSPHEAPADNCTCGFYGWRDRKFEDGDPFSALLSGLNIAWEPWAEVNFYGKIVEHEMGYRAEFQRVMAIHLSPGDSREKILGDVSWADLARAIGIPIIDQHGVEHK